METRIFDLRDTKRPQKEVEDQIGAAALYSVDHEFFRKSKEE